MFNQKIQRAGFEILQSDDQSIIFKANSKIFAIADSHTGLTVYQAIRNPNGSYQLLPGCKEGRSFRTVTNFVNARS